jgi:aerobic-type carbon monoxide dehydrogenase small subunit (CoxS/CutS family)
MGKTNKADSAVISFVLNSEPASFTGDTATPLLWVLRDQLKLTGTKYGCGIGQCGSCTVHVDGRARRACILPVSAVAGREVVTIEGLAARDGQELHPVQQAWLELDVSQCGYCQPGQIMSAADLLARNPNPSDADIDREITNICRCGTYVRLRQAIHRAAELSAQDT